LSDEPLPKVVTGTFSEISATPVPTEDLPKPISVIRETAARDVAFFFVRIFAWSMGASFFVVVLYIVLAFFKPADVANKLAGEVDEFLRVLQIIGTIFSPLLAFILGYYFGTPHPPDNRSSNGDTSKEQG
jgi:hypothetical protein